MKTNIYSRILTATIATLALITTNIGASKAQVISDMNRGNCGYGRNGKVISYSGCYVGYAIDTNEDFGYLIMEWDNGNQVNVYFNRNTRRAIINGKKGTIVDRINNMLCFATYEKELICTDA